LKKVEVTKARWEIFYELCELLEKFAFHMYNNVGQLSAFKKCKQTLNEDQLVVVVDFAENYTCRDFAEAQSSYYTRQSITIHPMVAIFSQQSVIKRDSVVIISPDLKHDASSVKACMMELSRHVKFFYPNIKEVIVWSDGCSAQYKSRIPLYNISKQFDCNLKITWNYYGSRHGKSEADGESAVIKSFVDSSIKGQQLTVNGAGEVFTLLQNSLQIEHGLSRRHFYYISTTTINDIRESIQALFIPPIPNVRKIHQVMCHENQLLYRKSSCYCVSNCLHDINEWKEFMYPSECF